MPYVRLILDLLLLRRGPQDMPAGTTFLYGAAIAYCSAEFIRSFMVGMAGHAVLHALIVTLALAVYVWLLLNWRGHVNRVPQTLSAMYCANAAIVVLLMGPTPQIAEFIAAVAQAGPDGQLPDPPLFATLVFLVIGCWGIAVSAHIYRHALQCHFALGLLAEIGFDFLLFFFVTALFE